MSIVGRNVLRQQQAADPVPVDVAHGVPPPRAAPALLRRVVLSESFSLGLSDDLALPFFDGPSRSHFWGVSAPTGTSPVMSGDSELNACYFTELNELFMPEVAAVSTSHVPSRAPRDDSALSLTLLSRILCCTDSAFAST